MSLFSLVGKALCSSCSYYPFSLPKPSIWVLSSSLFSLHCYHLSSLSSLKYFKNIFDRGVIQKLPLHVWKVLVLSSSTVYNISYRLYRKSNIDSLFLSILYLLSLIRNNNISDNPNLSSIHPNYSPHYSPFIK